LAPNDASIHLLEPWLKSQSKQTEYLEEVYKVPEIDLSKYGLFFDFKKLEELLYKDVESSFLDIIQQAKQDNETLYCLSLYYDGSTFGYLFPTYNTYERLASTNYHKDLSNPLTDEEYQFTHKWSPCDFYYHGNVEQFSNETDKLLRSIDTIYDELSIINEDDQAAKQFLSHVFELVIDVLKNICELEFIQQLWEQKKFLFVTLYCGDQSEEERIANAEAVGNPQWIVDKYISETDRAHELWNKAIKNKLLLKKPEIELESLLPEVKKYQPILKINADRLSISPQFTLRYLGDDPVEFECSNNSLSVLSLLQNHPDYEQLKNYYGSLSITSFDDGDLLFEFGKLVAQKIATEIKEQFPEKYYRVVLTGFDSVMIYIFRKTGYLPSIVSSTKMLSKGDMGVGYFVVDEK